METITKPEVADEVVDAPACAVAEYTKTAQALAELRKRLTGKTYALQTVAGDKEARADRLELVRLRTALENKRKELKAPALERSRLIDAEAKRIEGEILALEGPIDRQIKADEARREEERVARAAAEAARVAALRKRIDYLRGIATRAAGQPAAEIAAKIAMVEGITIGQDFLEFQAEAQDVHAQLLAQLRDMHTATVAQEAEAARVKAESERLARVDHFGRKLMELRSLSIGMAGRGVDALREALNILSGMEINPANWDEFAPQAEEARTAVLAELQAMLAAAEDRERVAAEQAAEAHRLAAQRAEQERIATEQRAAELKRQQEEVARAESERLERLAEEDRLAAAAFAALEEAKRAEAIEPERIQSLGDALSAVVAGMVIDRAAVITYGPEVQQFAAGALQTLAPILIGIDPGAPEGDRTICVNVPVPPADDGRRIKLGELCAEVGEGFKITEAFIAAMGIEPVGNDKRAVLYTVAQKRAIFAALRDQLDLLVAKS